MISHGCYPMLYCTFSLLLSDMLVVNCNHTDGGGTIREGTAVLLK